MRDSHTREGLAIAAGDDRVAGQARYEAQQLAGRLDELEVAQARRDQWTTAAARAQAQADAAQGELDARRAERSIRSYTDTDTDTATLSSWLRDARIRATRARDTAQKYDQWAEQAATDLRDLHTAIGLAIATPPSLAAARQQVQAERAAADRMAEIEEALDDTRLGLHAVRGHARRDLAAELTELQNQHPALHVGDPTVRWSALIGAADTADQQHLQELQARHDQAVTDCSWYRNTADLMCNEAEQESETIAALRAELAARTNTRTDPARSAAATSWDPVPAQSPGVERAEHIIQRHLIDTPNPPQDTPGPDVV